MSDRKSFDASRDLFRYRKAGRTRVYQLREVGDGRFEVWVASDGGGKERKSRRLVTLTDAQDTEPFFESIEQELRAGGWIRV